MEATGFESNISLADKLAIAVNNAAIGVTAIADQGVVSFGRIDISRVNINGIQDIITPIFAPGLAPEATVKRGIVDDGEVLVISTRSETPFKYEFESIVARRWCRVWGTSPVPFVAQSTPGDVAQLPLRRPSTIISVGLIRSMLLRSLILPAAKQQALFC